MTTLDPGMRSGTDPAGSARDRAMVCHDVRGALQGVIGGVAMLEGEALPPPAREQFDRIAASAKTLACLVDGLVGGSSPRRREAYGRVDLARFLRHLSRRWTGEAHESGHSLDVVVGPDLPAALEVDLVALARAVGNLLGNAVRHSRPGRIRLDLRRAPGGGVAFVVSDEGPGLPPAAIDAVRHPTAAMPADGHGLGLRIVATLTADMGGTLALANRADGGAEATLAFPARLCGDAPERRRATNLAADLEGLRILLAEDNPTNQMVATQMMRALGATVTPSSDGVEALEAFERAEFDLVVVDIEMPRMTGLDVIRAIRARGDRRAGVPIVALTAYAMREHRERIAAAGADGLISKPITSVEALGQALLEHVAPAVAPPDRAGPPPAPADDPVADLAVFEALCAAIGDEMMAELLDKVAADLLMARADLAGALAPLDPRPIRSASHILISVAGAIGATRLQSCARALNVAAHAAEAEGLPDDVRRCIVEIDAAVAFARGRRAAAG
jgi:CheY-like chemotaxis protein/two-component sensor histidine kinase/HPt (histidine-containing phosphotransfer) domain-containing protein